jgi:hypothetical protein
MALKTPPHEYEATVRYFADIMGLELLESDEPSVVFDFGGKNLRIDKCPGFSQAELWLEILCNDLEAAETLFSSAGVLRRDEIEPLPEGFHGFWITSPSNIIHLISKEMA